MFLTWAERINCKITSIKDFLQKPLPPFQTVLPEIYLCDTAILQTGIVQFFLYFKDFNLFGWNQ